MAKNPIKVMASVLTDTIYAGRVNPKTQMFVGEKEIVTDSAVSAVAQYLLTKEVEFSFSIKSTGEKYVLSVNKEKESVPDGYVLVPVKPKPEMYDAGRQAHIATEKVVWRTEQCEAIYKAMIAAAQEPT